MTFQSKMDSWLVVLIVATSVAVVVAMVPIIMQSQGMQLFIVIPIMMLAAVLPIWLLMTTRYVVDKEMLRIHCGPFRWKIRLDEIESIKATRNPLSSPALSLDRIMIRYRKRGRVMVSPVDKEKFAAAVGKPLE